MPQPRPGAPWPSPLPPPNVACCEFNAGGDFCDCAAFAAELFEAFAPRNLDLGRLGPITLPVQTGATPR
jgi:hypothetical protein